MTRPALCVIPTYLPRSGELEVIARCRDRCRPRTSPSCSRWASTSRTPRLRCAQLFAAAPVLIASFPKPEFHGWHLNHHHVNDWPLARFEEELLRAAGAHHRRFATVHFHQPQGMAAVVPGCDPAAPF